MSQLARVTPERTYQNMLKSNLQPEEKSIIKQWAEKIEGPLEIIKDIRVQDAPGGILSAVRQGSEGIAMAATLAFLQVNVKGGLDVRGVPVDGVGGLAVMGASAFMGHSELGTDARNLGQDATVICAYRKFVDAFSRMRLASGRELYPHLMPGHQYNGTPANDPVAQAAAAAGI